MEKSVVKNFFYSAAYSLINVIIPIIIMPYVSRILQPEGVGAVSYSQNIASYFILVASLGIPNYGVREIAKVRKNKCARSRVFAEIFLINFISTCLITIAYYFVIINVSYFEKYRVLLLVVGISLILNCCNIDWFYRGIEEFKYITLRGYAVKITAVLMVFTFVRNQRDVVIYALILTLATSSNYILNVIRVRKYLLIPKEGLKIGRHFKSIIYMFATAVAVEIYAQLDTTMLGLICGDCYVGYYTNAIRLTRIVAVVITSIGTILLPKLSIVAESGDTGRLSQIVNKEIEYIIFISIPSAVGLFLVSREVVLVLFGEMYIPSILTMRLLSVLIPILSIGNIYGTQLMVATGLEKKLTMTVFCGAGVNVLLNLILIPRYQQNGAAIASVAAEMIVMLLQIYFTRNIETKVNIFNIVKLLVQITVMMICIFIIKKLPIQPFIMLLIEGTVGVVVFLMVGFILKNSLLLEMLDTLRRKV